jgi:hypothetical protein
VDLNAQSTCPATDLPSISTGSGHHQPDPAPDSPQFPYALAIGLSDDQALRIALTLNEDGQKIAIALLKSIGSIELAEQLAGKIEAPEPTWLEPFAERLNIRVKSPQKIDEARRDHCNHCVIRTFFDGPKLLLDRDPSLILNCNEGDITS